MSNRSETNQNGTVRYVPVDSAGDHAAVRIAIKLVEGNAGWAVEPTRGMVDGLSFAGALVNADGASIIPLDLTVQDNVLSEIGIESAPEDNAGDLTDRLATLCASQPGLVLGHFSADSSFGWRCDSAGNLDTGNSEGVALVTMASSDSLEGFARRIERAAAESPSEERPRLFLAGSTADSRIAEVLLLKISLLESAARGLRDCVNVWGRPHLGLSAGSFRTIQTEHASPACPDLWTARSVLVAPPSGRRIVPDIGGPIDIDPRTVRRSEYRSDDLRVENTESQNSGSLTVSIPDPLPAGSIGLLVLRESAGRFLAAAHAEDDMLVVRTDPSDASRVREALEAGSSPVELINCGQAGAASDHSAFMKIAAAVLTGVNSIEALQSSRASDAMGQSQADTDPDYGIPDDLWTSIVATLCAEPESTSTESLYDTLVADLSRHRRVVQSLLMPDTRLRSEVAAAIDAVF